MLAIRMQRTGRKGHAQFRVIVQDSRRTPTSGKIVAQLGHYDPHTKQAVIDKEKANLYLSNGAQPSERVIRLLKSEKISVPAWAELSQKKTGAIRNPEKLRRNRPAEATTEPVAEETGADTAEAEITSTPEAPVPEPVPGPVADDEKIAVEAPAAPAQEAEKPIDETEKAS